MSRAKRWKLIAASYLIFGFVKLLRLTYRIRFFSVENRRRAEAATPSESFAMALWHEHLFAAILAHQHQRFAPLASLSADGDIVTFVMDRLGFRTVRGSSSRGGPEAREELVDVLHQGWFTALTVDGPRGPRRRVKGGIVDVARRTGVPVVPMAACADRAWVLSRSWDQFKIPKPFSRIAVAYGAPHTIPADAKGLAFGEAKSAVKSGLESAEADAQAALHDWNKGVPPTSLRPGAVAGGSEP